METHRRQGMSKDFSQIASTIRRAAEHHAVMEIIEHAKYAPPLEAEADKGNETEEKQGKENPTP